MPLVKSILKNDIKEILNEMKDFEGSQEQSIEIYSTKLSDAIDKYIKSGLVTTTGSSTTQTGTIA